MKVASTSKVPTRQQNPQKNKNLFFLTLPKCLGKSHG